MSICKNSKYFTVSQSVWEAPFGSCANMEEGYNVKPKDLKLNQILVENDEGWAALVGPEFGCINWEDK